MSEHASKLKMGRTNKFVDAVLFDDLSLDDLFDAEAIWAPARIRMLQELSKRNIPQSSWPQSLHWNWARKAAQLSSSQFGPLGNMRIFGVKADSQWQGMLLGKTIGHYTRLGQLGRELVYLDYVESAPWNWEEPTIEQEPRYKGVGFQLVELAARWSQQLGFGGRLGLHALPQAEDFYRRRCGTTDLGPDPDPYYHGMHYFEFTEEQVNRFLTG